MKNITKASAAQRLARTIASDILLYNKEKVADGIKNDNLFDVLKDEIAEGHKHFGERVDGDLLDKYNFVERALVDVLIHRSAHHPTEIW
ncbi:MAG: hypothetical protein R3F65_17125 [bacterium]|nr:hypothetical protein [Myxococcales bacterium]MCB9553065.1 hypothetical protein [Myxococcales bacterium]